MDVVIATLEQSGPATFDSLDDPLEAAGIAARPEGERRGRLEAAMKGRGEAGPGRAGVRGRRPGLPDAAGRRHRTALQDGDLICPSRLVYVSASRG